MRARTLVNGAFILLAMLLMTLAAVGCDDEGFVPPDGDVDGDGDLPDGDIWRCTFDSQCDPGFVCCLEACVLPADCHCTSDDECVLDQDCPSDRYCNPSCSCDTPPITDGDSDGDATPCDLENPCADGYECRNGFCVRATDGPVITMTPIAINFGVVEIGETLCRTLGVRNDGNETLKIFKMEFTAETSPDFHWGGTDNRPTDPPQPFDLQPGEQSLFNVCVKPQDPGKDEGRIEIICNDNPPTRHVSLTTEYKGVTTIEVANPQELYFDFGSVEVGDTKTMQVTLNNIQRDPTHNKVLSIGPIQFDPDMQADFSVPPTVQPNEIKYMRQGESLTFPVYFRPASEGMKSVELVVYHDADYYAGEGAPPRPLKIVLVGNGVVPCLTVEPNPIDFGQVTAGQAVSKLVTLRSTCGGTVRMTGLRWKDPRPDDFSLTDRGGCETAIIPPGERCVFRVDYEPGQVGYDAAFLLVESNNAAMQTMQIPVQGQGVQSVITVNPNQLNFGNVLINTVEERTFTITNMGAGDLQLQSATFDENTAFSMNPLDQGSLPMTLAYGESADFRVNYRPSNSTPGYAGDEGTLTIRTDNQSYPFVQVSLTGKPVWPYCEFRVVEQPNFVSTIDFGEVNLGTTKSVRLRISNSGGWPCQVHSLVRCPNTSSEFNFLPEYVPLIQPNTYYDVTVNYSPINYPGPDSGCITISTNDVRPSHSVFTVGLQGLGVNPTIFVEPTSTQSSPYSFGDVYKNACSNPTTFRVRNIGFGTLIVDPNYELIGIPGAWIVGGWSFPLNGLPNGHLRNNSSSGDEITFTVRFCPLGFSGIQQQGQVRVLSNDSERPSRRIEMVGRGVECPDGKFDVDGTVHPDPHVACEYTCPTPSQHRFPIEKCDTYDNDCNGLTDEGYGVGQSCMGIGRCGAGVWQCSPSPPDFAAICSSMPGGSAYPNPAPVEICNGLDDDCNGLTDEHFPVGQFCVGKGECGVGVFECATNFTVRCSKDIGGSAYPNPAPVEKCNNKDDNCDGFIDNGSFIILNSGDPPQICNSCVGVVCTGSGDCGWGTYECALNEPSGNYVRCSSDPGGSSFDGQVELCDGADNNCNGLTDEGFNLGQPCSGVGRCAEFPGVVQCNPRDPQRATTICSTDISGDDYPWMPEQCNGLDDNCNGQTDEDFSVGAPCLGRGECAKFSGQIECNPAAGVPGQPVTLCSTNPGGSNSKAIPELCNGLDDDCDGLTDEDFNVGFPCIGTGECGIGILQCRTLYETVCSTNPGGSNSQATTEVCDGKDNDCDGLTDENIVGNLSVGDPCDGQGECGLGVYVCKGLTALICSTEPGGPNNQATTEVCDGKDNDCDGLTDEDFLVGQLCMGTGECGQGTWECAGLNARRCSTNPGGSADQSRPEICDGKDNNCNGLIDEDFPLCNGNDSINNCGACGNACFVSNGTAECRNNAGGSCSCEVASCNTGWHNTDGLYSTGCECRDDQWDQDGVGNSCGTAHHIGTFVDNEGRTPVSISGNLAAPGDVDWFSFDAVDGPETGPNFGDRFNAQVQVTNQSGEVVVDIFRGNCTTKVCTATRHFDHRTDGRWTNTGQGDPWYTGQKPCLPTGQTGCAPADTCHTPYNWCETESHRFYIRVYRVLPPGQRASCGNYTLQVSNGYHTSTN